MTIRFLRPTAALCVLLAALAIGTRAAPAADRVPAEQIRGFSMQLNNPAGLPDYLKAIDELADMGCTSINFVLAARQENVRSEAMSIDWRSLPPQADIERILRYAKSKHIYTILMPIVLLNSAGPKEWRGVIQPPDWDTWFDNYRRYMQQVAAIAQRCDVDLLCVGSELLSTERLRSRWNTTIDEIKAVYKGKLTYSANWDHYEVPTFWDRLDYIGMNNYNELHGDTVAELDADWAPIKEKILKFVEKENKPFLFTEVGWHNLDNTLAEPWNYVATGQINLNEQKKAFESFVETWSNVPTTKFMGALVWEWDPFVDGATHHGAYTLQHTPALEVVKRWMRHER